MAPQSSAWTGEKPRKAGAGRGSAARSGEKVVPISPTRSASQNGHVLQAQDIHEITILAARGSFFFPIPASWGQFFSEALVPRLPSTWQLRLPRRETYFFRVFQIYDHPRR